MEMKDYQKKAGEFAVYADRLYPFLALSEEVGEFLGLIAKGRRGDDVLARFGGHQGYKDALMKEAGDVLWQLQQCLTELDLSLDEVAELNIQKLTDRKARSVLKGSGDNR